MSYIITITFVNFILQTGSKSLVTAIPSPSNQPSASSSFVSTTTSSPNPVLARGDPGKGVTPIIAGVVVAVIVILLIPIHIVGVLILITLRKRKKGSVELSLDNNGTILSNPVDQGNSLPVKGNPGPDMSLTNPVYGGKYKFKNISMYLIHCNYHQFLII